MLPFDFLHDFNVDGTLPFEAFWFSGIRLRPCDWWTFGWRNARTQSPGPPGIGSHWRFGKSWQGFILQNPSHPGFSPKKWFLFWGGARGASQQKDGQMMMSFAGSAAGKFALRPWQSVVISTLSLQHKVTWKVGNFWIGRPDSWQTCCNGKLVSATFLIK